MTEENATTGLETAEKPHHEIVKRLTSRKLWVLVFTMLSVQNAEINPEAMAAETVEALKLMVQGATAIVYLVSQAFVDGKK